MHLHLQVATRVKMPIIWCKVARLPSVRLLAARNCIRLNSTSNSDDGNSRLQRLLPNLELDEAHKDPVSMLARITSAQYGELARRYVWLPQNTYRSRMQLFDDGLLEREMRDIVSSQPFDALYHELLRLNNEDKLSARQLVDSIRDLYHLGMRRNDKLLGLLVESAVRRLGSTSEFDLHETADLAFSLTFKRTDRLAPPLLLTDALLKKATQLVDCGAHSFSSVNELHAIVTIIRSLQLQYEGITDREIRRLSEHLSVLFQSNRYEAPFVASMQNKSAVLDAASLPQTNEQLDRLLQSLSSALLLYQWTSRGFILLMRSSGFLAVHETLNRATDLLPGLRLTPHAVSHLSRNLGRCVALTMQLRLFLERQACLYLFPKPNSNFNLQADESLAAQLPSLVYVFNERSDRALLERVVRLVETVYGRGECDLHSAMHYATFIHRIGKVVRCRALLYRLRNFCINNIDTVLTSHRLMGSVVYTVCDAPLRSKLYRVPFNERVLQCAEKLVSQRKENANQGRDIADTLSRIMRYLQRSDCSYLSHSQNERLLRLTEQYLASTPALSLAELTPFVRRLRVKLHQGNLLNACMAGLNSRFKSAVETFDKKRDELTEKSELPQLLADHLIVSSCFVQLIEKFLCISWEVRRWVFAALDAPSSKRTSRMLSSALKLCDSFNDQLRAQLLTHGAMCSSLLLQGGNDADDLLAAVDNSVFLLTRIGYFDKLVFDSLVQIIATLQLAVESTQHFDDTVKLRRLKLLATVSKACFHCDYNPFRDSHSLKQDSLDAFERAIRVSLAELHAQRDTKALDELEMLTFATFTCGLHFPSDYLSKFFTLQHVSYFTRYYNAAALDLTAKNIQLARLYRCLNVAVRLQALDADVPWLFDSIPIDSLTQSFGAIFKYEKPADIDRQEESEQDDDEDEEDEDEEEGLARTQPSQGSQSVISSISASAVGLNVTAELSSLLPRLLQVQFESTLLDMVNTIRSEFGDASLRYGVSLGYGIIAPILLTWPPGEKDQSRSYALYPLPRHQCPVNDPTWPSSIECRLFKKAEYLGHIPVFIPIQEWRNMPIVGSLEELRMARRAYLMKKLEIADSLNSNTSSSSA